MLNIYVGNPDVNFAMFIRANLILVRTFCITAVLLHILQLPLIHDTMRVNMTVYTARISLRLVNGMAMGPSIGPNHVYRRLGNP